MCTRSGPAWSQPSLLQAVPPRISETFFREFSHLSLLLLCSVPSPIISVFCEYNKRLLFCRFFGSPTLTSKLSKRSMRKQEVFTAGYFSGHSTLRYAWVPRTQIGLESGPWWMETLDCFASLAFPLLIFKSTVNLSHVCTIKGERHFLTCTRQQASLMKEAFPSSPLTAE